MFLQNSNKINLTKGEYGEFSNKLIGFILLIGHGPIISPKSPSKNKPHTCVLNWPQPKYHLTT